MTLTKVLIFLSFGSLFLVLSLVSRRFYDTRTRKPVSPWIGRVLLALVGLVFMAYGLRYFFSSH
jgi:hypothetical protein